MSTTTPTKTWTKTAERPLRSAAKSLGVYLFAHFVGVPVPWKAVRQTDGKALLAYEHERLLALSAAGEQVPLVVAFDGDAMVTGDVGTTLEHLLHRIPEADRLPLMCAASADLAGFHARGHWHGGAQARNLTWDGHRFARIDFEERLYPGLPLNTVQRYDALQLVFSLARFLEPLGSVAVQDVLNAYRDAWVRAKPDAPESQTLRSFLKPLLPRLRRIDRLASWSTRLDGSRELIRLRTVLEGMTSFVEDSPR